MDGLHSGDSDDDRVLAVDAEALRCRELNLKGAGKVAAESEAEDSQRCGSLLPIIA